MSSKVRAKWPGEAQEIAKKTISSVSEQIHANTWEKRSKELHRVVTKALDANLTANYKKCVQFSNKNSTFYSVAMLTFNDKGKSCTKDNKDSVYGTHEYVTYLAQPDFGDKLAPYTNLLENYEQEILDKTFSSPSTNLCETAAKAINDVLKLSLVKKASPLAVVRCGYKFIWYELGYEYFPAAYSTSPYKLESSHDNVYSANCGQIVLFP
ncbi:hypothetical protein AAVH_24234 [Aphelenchoides avenae]|nr:hypothetical protein AAVH_24234 [Aphelenchus avenae]